MSYNNVIVYHRWHFIHKHGRTIPFYYIYISPYSVCISIYLNFIFSIIYNGIPLFLIYILLYIYIYNIFDKIKRFVLAYSNSLLSQRHSNTNHGIRVYREGMTQRSIYRIYIYLNRIQYSRRYNNTRATRIGHRAKEKFLFSSMV